MALKDVQTPAARHRPAARSRPARPASNPSQARTTPHRPSASVGTSIMMVWLEMNTTGAKNAIRLPTSGGSRSSSRNRYMAATNSTEKAIKPRWTAASGSAPPSRSSRKM